MTLYEFLMMTGVDVIRTDSSLGNLLDGELASRNKKINYEQEVNKVSDDDLYEIGRIIILHHNKGKAFFQQDIVEAMKDKIKEYSNYNS